MVGIGSKLYGFCEGYFGRDSYNEKIIEAIGRDWVVVRERVYVNDCKESYDAPNLAFFKNYTHEEMMKKLEEWSKEFE